VVAELNRFNSDAITVGMESDENKIARLSVEAILKDLKERRANGDSWEDIDSEIESAWYHIILGVARPIMQEIK